MKVTVVGGSGFVGRHYVQRILAQNTEVTNVDLRPPAAPAGQVKFIAADMTSPADVSEAISLCTETDHLVWLPATIEQATDVDDSARRDTQVMAEAAVEFVEALGERLLGITYMSSVQVYGQPQELPVNEEHSTDPFTAYGVAKLLGEKLLQIACKRFGVPVAIWRAAFIYGPGQHGKNVIPRFVDSVQRGVPPTVFSAGDGIRDDIHIDDVVTALETSTRTHANGVFNLSTGRAHTLTDVATVACQLVGGTLTPNHQPGGKLWIDRYYDATKAKEHLGFEAGIDLHTGMQTMMGQAPA